MSRLVLLVVSISGDVVGNIGGTVSGNDVDGGVGVDG